MATEQQQAPPRFVRKGKHASIIRLTIVLVIVVSVAWTARILYLAKGGSEIFQHDLCLVYDKPYRTGSTTVERSLCDCWKTKFNATDRELSVPVERIPIMMNKTDPVVMRCIGHVTIIDDQIRKMRSQCKKLFFLTSTRPMQERLASYGKNDAIYGQIYTNMTLSRDQLRNAVHWARTRGRAEEFRYEMYPYIEKSTLRIEPDYVIRKENFEEDLLHVLEAFDCPREIRSTNIHALEIDGDIAANAKPGRTRERTMLNATSNLDDMTFEELKEELDNVPLNYGDKLHVRMHEIAKIANQDGLRRARLLLEQHGVNSTINNATSTK